jgi:hypothetical protein
MTGSFWQIPFAIGASLAPETLHVNFSLYLSERGHLLDDTLFIGVAIAY